MGKLGKEQLLVNEHAPQSSSLFRENALKEMNGVQVLQQGLQVVEAKSIAYLLTALAGIIGILLWGIYGVLEMEVQARGLLLPAKQIALSEKIYQEDSRERENALRELKVLLAKKQALFEKRLITVDDLERARQAYLAAREAVANTPRLNNQHAGNLFAATYETTDSNLNAIVFVSHTEGKKISAGMQAYVLPSFSSAYEYGYIKGMVSNVSEYPVSKESVFSYLGNMNLVDDYFASGAPFVVKIILENNKYTVSGLKWTTQRGAPFKVGAGSAVTVKIIHHQYHPYELMFT